MKYFDKITLRKNKVYKKRTKIKSSFNFKKGDIFIPHGPFRFVDKSDHYILLLIYKKNYVEHITIWHQFDYILSNVKIKNSEYWSRDIYTTNKLTFTKYELTEEYLNNAIENSQIKLIDKIEAAKILLLNGADYGKTSS